MRTRLLTWLLGLLGIQGIDPTDLQLDDNGGPTP